MKIGSWLEAVLLSSRVKLFFTLKNEKWIHSETCLSFTRLWDAIAWATPTLKLQNILKSWIQGILTQGLGILKAMAVREGRGHNTKPHVG